MRYPAEIREPARECGKFSAAEDAEGAEKQLIKERKTIVRFTGIEVANKNELSARKSLTLTTP